MRITLLLAVGIGLAGCVAPGIASRPAATPRVPDIQSDRPDIVGTGIEGLQAYGQAHVDEFGGLYIDPPGGHHVVMLFTTNLEAHAEAIEAIQPGTTVRQVDHSEAELIALLESIDFEDLAADGVEMIGAGVDVINNRVTLDAKSNDPSAALRLEVAYGGLLDATIFPLPGEWTNVAADEGWRLIAAGQSATDAYTVRAATDEVGYAEMWKAIGLDGEAPVVDLASEVVVSFGHGVGSTCPEVRLDDVRIEAGVVLSVTSDPLEPRACTADLVGAAAFVVAIARDAVPGGFTLWLNEFAADRADGEFSAPVEVELP